MYKKENAYFKNKYVEIAYGVEDDEEEDYPIIIGETFGIDEESVMLHYHRRIEICYIRQGTGNYLIDGRDYPFHAGDIFIISDNEIHLAYMIKMSLFKSFCSVLPCFGTVRGIHLKWTACILYAK